MAKINHQHHEVGMTLALGHPVTYGTKNRVNAYLGIH